MVQCRGSHLRVVVIDDMEVRWLVRLFVRWVKGDDSRCRWRWRGHGGAVIRDLGGEEGLEAQRDLGEEERDETQGREMDASITRG